MKCRCAVLATLMLAGSHMAHAQVTGATAPIVIGPASEAGSNGATIGPSSEAGVSSTGSKSAGSGRAVTSSGAGRGGFAPGTTPSTAINGAPVPSTAVSGTPAIVPGKK